MLQGSEVPTANNYSSAKRYPPLPIEISTNITQGNQSSKANSSTSRDYPLPKNNTTVPSNSNNDSQMSPTSTNSKLFYTIGCAELDEFIEENEIEVVLSQPKINSPSKL